MTNEINYYDTNYTYINPVRYFKANDPYYFEVDNIPIKQLEESTNFLKDQVDGILAKGQEPEDAIEIDRSGFSELKPYAVGNDYMVRVKPGRYSSRINNAYNLTPLQVIQQVFGFTSRLDDPNIWATETNKGSYVSGVLEEFMLGTGSYTTLNMNGLFERSFVWPIDTVDGQSLGDPDLLNITSPLGYGDSLSPDDRPLYPNVIGALIKHSTNQSSRDLTLLKNLYNPTNTFGGQQGKLESEFIKRWRGAIRTSIVDVPSELEIPVPEFQAGDFFYIDESGNNVPVNANHRIDLLFIYSKAIDEESTTIPKFNSLGEPTPLFAPALGIVKGAGLGVSRATAPGPNNETNADDRVNLQTMDGVSLMVAHPGDENALNSGFTTSAGTVKGSFPSPDDLLNLAPVLSENLQSTSFALIGQTILPVAYIIVEKDNPLISGREPITNDHIFDIRPFFRTTELAYNERAGIAAATPQVSIANPVVTEAHLAKVKADVFSYVKGLSGPVDPSNPPPPIQPNGVIAAGVVTGGFNYGPEGALCRQRAVDGASLADVYDSVIEEFGYYPNSVQTDPLWDKANWYHDGGYQDDGAADYINVGDTTFVRHGNNDSYRLPPWNSEAQTTIGGSPADPTYQGNLGNMLWGKRFRYHEHRSNDDIARNTNKKRNEIFFVSKRINLSNFPVDESGDVLNYHVNVQFLNCIPLTSLGHGPNTQEGDTHAQPAGIWVVKHPNYFIINVAWPNDGLFSRHGDADRYTAGYAGKPWGSRNSAKEFCGFMLPAFDAATNNTSDSYDNFDSVLQDDMQAGGGSHASVMIAEVNEWMAPGDSYPVSHFRAITPILYPSVSFEIIGMSNYLYSKAMGSGEVTNLNGRDGSSHIDFLTT